jgi:uncharacterized membrane protein YhaH (DUF805 family)
MKTITGIFWPINRKNYFFWPLIILIPLMGADVLTTTLALQLGYQEQNSLLSSLIKDPALHAAFKLTIPILLLFLCIFIYYSERRYGSACSHISRNLLELAKISIFVVLLYDCIFYLGIVWSNIALISG